MARPVTVVTNGGVPVVASSNGEPVTFNPSVGGEPVTFTHAGGEPVSFVSGPVTGEAKMVTYGDSLNEYQYRATATTIDHQTQSDMAWAVALTNKCVVPVYYNAADAYGRNFTGMNLGDSGDTAANCAGSTRLNELITFTPDIVYVHAGTNDILAGNSAATVVANLTTICTTLTAQGYYVILSTIPPNDSWTTPDQLTDPRYAVRKTANNLIKALVLPKVYIADVNLYVEDFTSRGGLGGLWKANYYASGADLVHFSAEGSYQAAKALMPIISSLVHGNRTFDHTTGNLLTNWQLSGTSGSRNPTTAGLITGPGGGATEIADNWRVSRSSGTNATAIETSKEVDGAYSKQVITCKPGGSSAFENWQFESFISSSNLIARDASIDDGEWVQFRARLEVSAWGPLWGGYEVILQAYNSSDVLQFSSTGLKYLDRTNRNYPQEAVDVIVETVPMQVVTAWAKFRIQVNLYPKMQTALTNGVIKISKPWFGVVPNPNTNW